MADARTPVGRSVSGPDSTTLEEYRDYAVDCLAGGMEGWTDPLSDGRQRRIRIAESPENGSVVLRIEGPQYTAYLDRLIRFTVTANELPDSGLVPPPVSEPQQIVVTTVAPEGFELVTTSMLANLRAELAEAQRVIGEERAQHQAAMSGVQQKSLAEMQAYRQTLDTEYAARKRSDAEASIARSRTMLTAKIAEHVAPLLEGFPYNLKEVRHVGELFDFLVLEGLEDGKIRNVIFLEIKNRRTGNRVSNPRERMLRDAVEAGRVKYEVFAPNVGKAEGQ